MALIRSFKRAGMTRNSIHPQVGARYEIFEQEGRTIVQVNTYGSANRKHKDVPSQTIQLDRAGADALRAILDEAFPL